MEFDYFPKVRILIYKLTFDRESGFRQKLYEMVDSPLIKTQSQQNIYIYFLFIKTN